MLKADKIQLAVTEQCTGCEACVSICPTNSITMKSDKEGFLQPHTDTETCIKCHKCEKTCPIIKPIDIPTDFETQAYVAINKDDDVRMRSSSGGMFYALAKWTIEQGGVVFGARFDENWDVVHDYTETKEGIEPFMRSKYVQSRIGETYKQAKEFLKEGRQVLFVGTPCQIGGLHAYLGKDYENLIMVDFICHGVPSPGVWRKYLKWKTRGDIVLDVNFRDKTNGWLRFQQVTTTTTTTIREGQMENAYFAGFLNNVFLRRSCYDCNFKQLHRKADLTIADCWGVEEFAPDMHDDKGTSVVFIHTQKGANACKAIAKTISSKTIPVNVPVSINDTMVDSVPMPKLSRIEFFSALAIGGFQLAQNFVSYRPFYNRVLRKIKRLLHI